LLLGPSHDAIIQGTPTTTPGNVTFVQLPGTVWSAEQVHGAFFSIELGPELFARLLYNWPLSTWLPPSQVILPHLMSVFSRAHNAFRHNEVTTRTEALVELLRQVLVALTGIEPRTPNCDAVSRARDALHASLNRSPTIDELATEAGITPFEFVRAFRDRYGIGPSTYRRALQIARARQLLRRGLSSEEVTAELGFTSGSALTRSFVAQLGLEPASYAEQATGRTRLEPN
jgi:AraC-like DNA-binding protein